MAGTATVTPQHSVLPADRLRRLRPDLRLLAPSLFAVANATAFFLIRPDVNDLWAARARASAVSHGVGLTYWFSWFGGGSTPGNYSIVTPYLSAAVGTELLGAISAVLATVLATVLLRGTRHPVAASAFAAVGVGVNLWSGRVPFLLGAVFAVAALITVQRKLRTATVALTIVSILASPVSGAFVAMALSGTFLTTRTKAYRPIIAYAVITVVLSLGAVAVAFGTPGSEPFSRLLLFEVVLGVALLLVAKPADNIRTTIWVSLLATVCLYAIPNGMGSNFARFIWFCLPVAVVATSTLRTRVVVGLMAPLVAVGTIGTVNDLLNAARPVSSTTYYSALVGQLDKIDDLRNYRVEVVNHGAHAGYDALLGHASLARGWETQEDIALNDSLNQSSLDEVTYKVWLDNNAVGYVALPSASVGGYPEYTLVQSGRSKYLTRIWSDDDWQLFRVTDPTPIVGLPASITDYSQSTMTITVPCVCTIAVRVRWSKFLDATRETTSAQGAKGGHTPPVVRATVADDGSGWTTITTTAAGSYVLSGSIRGLLH